MALEDTQKIEDSYSTEGGSDEEADERTCTKERMAAEFIRNTTEP